MQKWQSVAEFILIAKIMHEKEEEENTREDLLDSTIGNRFHFIFIHSQVKWWMDKFIIIWINYFCILWFESPQPGSLNTHEFNWHNHNTGFPLYLQVSTRKYIVVIIYQKYRQHREHRFHCSKWSEALNLFCSFTCILEQSQTWNCLIFFVCVICF